jgi:hypothetical protein
LDHPHRPLTGVPLLGGRRGVEVLQPNFSAPTISPGRRGAIIAVNSIPHHPFIGVPFLAGGGGIGPAARNFLPILLTAAEIAEAHRRRPRPKPPSPFPWRLAACCGRRPKEGIVDSLILLDAAEISSGIVL